MIRFFLNTVVVTGTSVVVCGEFVVVVVVVTGTSVVVGGEFVVVVVLLSAFDFIWKFHVLIKITITKN
jgi:hypothetical protein